MQSASCFLIDRFGQECCRFAFLCRHIFDDIFDNHRIIRHCRHIRKLYFDLHLSRAAYFMMMIFYFDAPVFHHHTHTAAQIVPYILRSRYVIAAFIRHFISVISRAELVQTAVPIRLSRIDTVPAPLRRHFETRFVKQIELEFGPNDHFIGNAAFLHIFHRAQTDIFRVLVKRFVFIFPDRTHITAHRQCRHFRKRIHICGIRVRKKYHIAFLDRRIPVIRTVKSDSVSKRALSEPLYGNRNVTPPSVNIRHLKIDHTNIFLLTQFLNFLHFVHTCNPSLFLLACACCPSRAAD